jgi:hypothetical protein
MAKKGLAATGAAADQSWPASRNASPRDLIETPDARRAFFQNINRLFYLNHRHLPVPLIFPILNFADITTERCIISNYFFLIPEKVSLNMLRFHQMLRFKKPFYTLPPFLPVNLTNRSLAITLLRYPHASSGGL